MKTNRLICFLSLTAMFAAPPLAAVYQVGDVADDFELIDRATGEPVHLSDFEGKIVLLEWFAFWCPFCQAAAPQVDEGISQYYADRGGNPAGLPVIRVGVNLQRDASSSYKAKTDAFVLEYHLSPTLEDNSRLVAGLFFLTGGQPLFAVINGIKGTPSHEQWEILALESSYGSSTAPISVFRAAIDSVQAPSQEPPTPVRLIGEEPAGGGVLRLRIEGNRRDEIVLRRSRDFITWTTIQAPIPEKEEDVLELALADLSGDRFVQAVRME